MHLDQQVKSIMESRDSLAIDSVIQQYTPFIIATVSEQLGRYLSVENDEAFSIGLSAFYEAMERHDIEKGHFLPFARIVIRSRVSSSKNRKEKGKQTVEWDEQVHSLRADADNALKDEIVAFEAALNRFGMDFDMLADRSPKHRDTRDRANRIAFQTSRVPQFVAHIYKKKRLPIVKMAERFFVSIKVIKRSKSYILAAVVIWTEKYIGLQEWLKPKRAPNFTEEV